MKFEEAKEKSLETNAVLALAFLVLYVFFAKSWVLYTSLFFLIVGLFVKPLSGPISWIWLGLGHVLGSVVSRVLLFLFFFLILTPFATLYRLFNKSKLMTFHGERDSFFQVRDHTYSKDDLERPW